MSLDRIHAAIGSGAFVLGIAASAIVREPGSDPGNPPTVDAAVPPTSDDLQQISIERGEVLDVITALGARLAFTGDNIGCMEILGVDERGERLVYRVRNNCAARRLSAVTEPQDGP